MGDCVGGVLCFDALCFSNHQRPASPNNSSRNNSTESLKVGARRSHDYNVTGGDSGGGGDRYSDKSANGVQNYRVPLNGTED